MQTCRVEGANCYFVCRHDMFSRAPEACCMCEYAGSEIFVNKFLLVRPFQFGGGCGRFGHRFALWSLQELALPLSKRTAQMHDEAAAALQRSGPPSFGNAEVSLPVHAGFVPAWPGTTTPTNSPPPPAFASW